jgi:hypothetical protein
MGYNIDPNDLADLCKWVADVKVTCRKCRRWAIFPLLPLLHHFRQRGWNTSWGCVARRFVCKGTEEDRGCGSKELWIGLAPHVEPTPPEPTMTKLQMQQRAKRERH